MANHMFVPNIPESRLFTPVLYTPRGPLLLSILTSEFNNVRFRENELSIGILSCLAATNSLNTTMRYLGKIAEAAIVKHCTSSLSANKAWLSIAGLHNLSIDNIKNCIPIGTGLSETKQSYRYLYSPNDPQYDIIWCDSNHKAVLKNVDTGTGIYTGEKLGLQIKTKTSYVSILNDLKNKKYSVPLVYIDVNDDFEQLIERIEKDHLDINIDKEIFSPKYFDSDLYEEVCDFGKLLLGIISGHYSPNILLNEMKVNSVLRAGSKKLTADASLLTANVLLPDSIISFKNK